MVFVEICMPLDLPSPYVSCGERRSRYKVIGRALVALLSDCTVVPTFMVGTGGLW